MKYPIDNAELVMTERQNVEIDYCPKCRGVWLDRGELDKIIERVNNDQKSGQSDAYIPQTDSPSGRDDNRGYDKKKRRESWFGELFD